MNKELIKEALERSVDVIYPSRQELEKVLCGNPSTGLRARKLRIYLGVDPTGPHLHFGHVTNFLMLRRFQELGHEIILLIGDFTARIGDPTDKLAPRQPLTEEQIAENFKTFKNQVSKIIKFSGPNKAQVKFNSKWLSKLSFADLIKLAQHITVQQMMQRDMFQRRLRHWICPTCGKTNIIDPRLKDVKEIEQRCFTSGCGWSGTVQNIIEDKPISLSEFLYPMMQGYDSVAMDVDMEIGGTDQTFNMLMGRDLQKIYNNKEKFVITTKLLVNPKTGRKLMNKSEGGMINLDDAPKDIFAKVMAIDDAAMFALAEYSTEMPMEEFLKLKEGVGDNKISPRDAKLKIAFAAVEMIYGKKEAKKAEEEFVRVVSNKEAPSEVQSQKLKVKSLSLVDLLVETKLASSKSEARRLIEQGGVKINGEKQDNPNKIIEFKKEVLLQVGKRKYLRINS